MTIKEGVLLAPYTTFCSGGFARFFCTVTSEEELLDALSFAKKKHIPFFILGGGSNILFSDSGFDGLVIRMAMCGVKYEEKGDIVYVTAQAGEIWDAFVLKSLEKGLWGLENLSYIPGTVGASPVQNIGAYGVEVKDTILCVRVLDSDSGEFMALSRAECDFSYRKSIFKKKEYKKYIIVSVTYELTRIPNPRLEYKDVALFFGLGTTSSLEHIRNAIMAIRREKFPSLDMYGTAGSFWKNPIVSKEKIDELKKNWPELPTFSVSDGMYKIPLAWVLDVALHLKGYSVGACRLFEKQPLVLVSKKDTSSKEIELFAFDIEKRVYDVSGINIEREVELV